MNPNFKLAHVLAFLEITRERNLTRAAERLGLTQPAMSRRLKELEEAVGTTLLTRDRGGVRLTEAGTRFLHHASAGFAELQLAAERAGASASGGRLAVGALPSVAARVLPGVVGALLSAEPDLVVSVEEGSHGYLMEALRGGQLDVVLGRLGAPGTMQGVSFTQLYMEHVVIVAAAGHALSHVSRLDELGEAPLIYPSPRAAIRPLVDRLFLSQGIAAGGRRVESVSDSFGRALVRRAGYLWIISHGVVADALDHGEMVLLPVDMSLTAGPVGIMTRADSDTGPELSALRRAVSETLAELRVDGTGVSA